MNSDYIKQLLEKLNHESQKTVESAVGNCVNSGHRELTWPHLLKEMSDSTENDVFFLMKHLSIDSSKLKKALFKELESMPGGSSEKPLFSHQTISILQKAWNISSIDFGRDSIRTGILFLAGLDETSRSVSEHASFFRHVDTGRLRSDFGQITALSTESSVSSKNEYEKPAENLEEAEKVLNKYCVNFTQEAREGKIDAVSGRDEEICKLIDILCRRRKNNPILVGDAGVGKTAVVEGLAIRAAEGSLPSILNNNEIFSLDLGILQAGASVKGEFEKRLKNVLNAVKMNAGRIILFIDEAHTLIGAGGQAGQNDAANLLKPALARGEIRTIAATTWSEYRKYFEKDPALTRRFQLVKIEEPDRDKAAAMLRGISEKYETFHNVHISEDAVVSAVSLSDRYISGRKLPDKAIDLLDTACSRVKMSLSATPDSIENLKHIISDTVKRQNRLEKDSDAGIRISNEELEKCDETLKEKKKKLKRLNIRWKEELKLVKDIISLREELNETPKQSKNSNIINRESKLNKIVASKKKLEKIQNNAPLVSLEVTPQLCAKIVSDWTGIPLGSMVRDEAEVLLNLEDKIAEKIKGQEEAVSKVCDRIRASKAGVGNREAPIGVFLFAGPSGVGKTEFAHALAEYFFGQKKFLTAINMSEYQEKHTVSQLKGSPPGYVGYGEGGILTEAVRQKPYSLVLLDEIEKAHPEVMNLFYQVFDKGFMRDGEGVEINFKNTIIIMTTNLCSELIVQEQKNADYNKLTEKCIKTVSEHFKPAIAARMTILPFMPLEHEQIGAIAVYKLERLKKQLFEEKGVALSWSKNITKEICRVCENSEAGARAIDTYINYTLIPDISRILLGCVMEKDGEKRDSQQNLFIDISSDNQVTVSSKPANMS